jgi:hypothetical protein
MSAAKSAPNELALEGRGWPNQFVLEQNDRDAACVMTMSTLMKVLEHNHSHVHDEPA